MNAKELIFECLNDCVFNADNELFNDAMQALDFADKCELIAYLAKENELDRCACDYAEAYEHMRVRDFIRKVISTM